MFTITRHMPVAFLVITAILLVMIWAVLVYLLCLCAEGVLRELALHDQFS